MSVTQSGDRPPRKLDERRARDLEGFLALLLIVAGVTVVCWPAGLIVAGVLLALDRATS